MGYPKTQNLGENPTFLLAEPDTTPKIGPEPQPEVKFWFPSIEIERFLELEIRFGIQIGSDITIIIPLIRSGRFLGHDRIGTMREHDESKNLNCAVRLLARSGCQVKGNGQRQETKSLLLATSRCYGRMKTKFRVVVYSTCVQGAWYHQWCQWI